MFSVVLQQEERTESISSRLKFTTREIKAFHLDFRVSHFVLPRFSHKKACFLQLLSMVIISVALCFCKYLLGFDLDYRTILIG